jgi:hypothetical protein
MQNAVSELPRRLVLGTSVNKGGESIYREEQPLSGVYTRRNNMIDPSLAWLHSDSFYFGYCPPWLSLRA